MRFSELIFIKHSEQSGDPGRVFTSFLPLQRIIGQPQTDCQDKDRDTF